MNLGPCWWIVFILHLQKFMRLLIVFEYLLTSVRNFTVTNWVFWKQVTTARKRICATIKIGLCKYENNIQNSHFYVNVIIIKILHLFHLLLEMWCSLQQVNYVFFTLKIWTLANQIWHLYFVARWIFHFEFIYFFCINAYLMVQTCLLKFIFCFYGFVYCKFFLKGVFM